MRSPDSFKGQWVNATNQYLDWSSRFTDESTTDGPRLSIQDSNFSFTATLTGYAYETTLNKAITAGETKESDDPEQPVPASLKTLTEGARTLGALALGAPGLSICRREKSVAAPPEEQLISRLLT
jgi:hypothetical protein